MAKFKIPQAAPVWATDCKYKYEYEYEYSPSVHKKKLDPQPNPDYDDEDDKVFKSNDLKKELPLNQIFSINGEGDNPIVWITDDFQIHFCADITKDKAIAELWEYFAEYYPKDKQNNIRIKNSLIYTITCMEKLQQKLGIDKIPDDIKELWEKTLVEAKECFYS